MNQDEQNAIPKLDSKGRAASERPSLTPTDDQPNPQVVYVSTPMTAEDKGEGFESEKAKRKEIAAKKHEESKQKYPEIKLSEKEYIVQVVERHSAGIIMIWAGFALAVIVIMIILAVYAAITSGTNAPSPMALGLLMIPIVGILAIFSLAATRVYRNNRLYVTSENIIMIMQDSPFHSKGQTIPLISIEAVTYRKEGILNSMTDMGALEFIIEGTAGEHHRFSYVHHPLQCAEEVSIAIDNYRSEKNVFYD